MLFNWHVSKFHHILSTIKEVTVFHNSKYAMLIRQTLTSWMSLCFEMVKIFYQLYQTSTLKVCDLVLIDC